MTTPIVSLLPSDRFKNAKVGVCISPDELSCLKGNEVLVYDPASIAPHDLDKFSRFIKVEANTVTWLWKEVTACPSCRTFPSVRELFATDMDLESLLVHGTRTGLWGKSITVTDDKVWIVPVFRDPDCTSCHSENDFKQSSFVARFYHENTRLSGLPALKKSVPLSVNADYASAEPKTALQKVIAQRRSVREFAATKPPPLPFILETLLFSAGVMEASGKRAAPSGGGLYPIDLFVLMPSEKGTELFYYNSPRHQLETVKASLEIEEVARHTGYPELIRNAGAVFLLRANLDVTCHKYGDRGYRLALLEAGHIAQNILLLATDNGLQGCPLLGFKEQYFDRLVNNQSSSQVMIYMIAIGSP